MNDDSDKEETVVGDDYYAFLNVARDASEEDISNAYRRFSRLYHPDKHSDPERKKEAEVLFNKTKKAYEVLIDPYARAIYDNCGTAGLETRGWEVVKKTRTPQEIREKYEQLAKEEQERKLLCQTNPKSSFKLSINATELFTPDDDNVQADLRDIIGMPHIEVSGLSMSQSIEAPLTTTHTALLSGRLNTSNGRGAGSMNCSIRRITSSKGWAELEAGAGEGLCFNMKGFRYFTQGFFGNGNIMTQFSPQGLYMGSVATLGHQMDNDTVGYLTWRTGSNSGMTTMLIKQTEHWHLIGSVFFGIPHSHFSMTCTRKIPSIEAKIRVTGRVGTFGLAIEYGAEKKVSQHSTFGAKMSIGVFTGVNLRLKLERSSQTYVTHIRLCDEILPAPVIYGTVIPLVGWFAIQKLIVQPYLKQKKVDELRKQREANKSRLAAKRDEATAAIKLMTETVKRIVEQEESKKGLVIIQALYGHLVADTNAPEDDVDDENNTIIDVTVPLQCLVKDSKLILQDCSKSQLPGFYDPCPGEDKYLRLKYLFRAVVHEVTIKDAELLKIPKQSHRVEA